ncbi:hypothetical protein ACIBH1_05185 [Nonomuraea sp. NPDC050663]|uniref:hypothetical protein n=1 Tax=Nonomuraea sp. NPDC050663 TaxID=3364370 RepID=UPI00379B1DBA
MAQRRQSPFQGLRHLEDGLVVVGAPDHLDPGQDATTGWVTSAIVPFSSSDPSSRVSPTIGSPP